MIPLKVAILWHFHQPYYKKDNEFILPWVRLHGVKDYWDLPELFHDYPQLKQTINLVPAMQMQVQEYVSGKTSDRIQELSRINASNLDKSQKQEILRSFFLCNEENMIRPHPRYKYLLERSRNGDDALNNFTEQDWRDLQVWYNLAWFGQLSRKRLAINRLFRKEEGFSEKEKQIVLNMHMDILSQISSQLKMLRDMGQIEVSVSPMYHPILPLLCNSESALEALRDVKMPKHLFRYPQDADKQIRDGLEYYKNMFGNHPDGMWPSEGSISDESLALAADANIKWIASDEKVLAGSIGKKYKELDKYFPRKIKTENGYIAGLFRDVRLSDAIGFEYSRWNHFDAVNDFIHRLRHIKSQLANEYGEECLKHAVVPVILDGENCWEFYQNNGEQFLREFFHQLEDMKDFESVTCSEATNNEHLSYLSEIKKIKAGSWINGDFNIWIGHEEHRTAWSLLADARKMIEEEKDDLENDQLDKAMNEIYIAEGSDWFWWYGDAHQAPNKADFDVLFRWHLRRVYEITGKTPPEELEKPLSEQKEQIEIKEQTGDISPEINGIIAPENEWENAGFYDAATSMGAMHQIGEILNRIYFASSGNKIYLRIDIKKQLIEGDHLIINIHAPSEAEISMNSSGVSLSFENRCKIFQYTHKEIFEIEFDRSAVINDDEESIAEMTIETKTKEGEITYPRQGRLNIRL